jgi:hypothetical protein
MLKRMLPRTGRSKPRAQARKGAGQTRNTRRHNRRACSVETHFAAERQLFEGTIKNLSDGGTYIQVKGRFILGGDIIVAGPFADDQDDVKRRGKIVRTDGNGIAVSFIP